MEITSLIKSYLDFYQIQFNHRTKRNSSMVDLPFPFKYFRSGQREMAKYAYSVATKGGSLYAEAPTGIGKTISTLYPFILSFKEQQNEKIFYVTAKSSGQEAASLACRQMRTTGAYFKDITLTAKEKICFTPKAGCNPDECPFAKGYYDKIKSVILEGLNSGNQFGRLLITQLAEKHQVCPFELQLDLSLFLDVIIADYNYVFDPMVYLRRYFDNPNSNNLLLVDEAHNLVERSRDMYSCQIDYLSLLKMKKTLVKASQPKLKAIVTKIKKLFTSYLEDLQEITKVVVLEKTLIRSFELFLTQSQDYMKKNGKLPDAFLDFYFEVNRFIKIYEIFGPNFISYLKKDGAKNLSIKILCLDPSSLIKTTLKKFKGRVLFSATLSPIDYFLPVLGSQEGDPVLRLPSPFPRKNLLLMVAPNVSTRYSKRTSTLNEVAIYIEMAIKQKTGNYLVFFPSYKYMNEVIPNLKLPSDNTILVQTQDMKALEQASFLEKFVLNPQNTVVGFVVLGGAFAEGIDLIADRLIGSIIIGVGLPQLSFERDIIRDYFTLHGRDGYSFSYVYPGMNRVMQAVGRVIRSEKDQGIALLIDDRYLSDDYRKMFRPEWQDYEVTLTPDDVEDLVVSFWKNSFN
jgi:DNA excision repair protein ERCC-2